jgi:hypothetical protein
MRRGFLSAPPPALRRAKLDNLALVPASLLPCKHEYQRIANRLPAGATLSGLPRTMSRSRRTLERVTSLIRTKGHAVTTIAAGRFG